jgi:hypothetical protein
MCACIEVKDILHLDHRLCNYEIVQDKVMEFIYDDSCKLTYFKEVQ